jgi:hypothetical protein
MTMFRSAQREMDRREGTATAVLLADRSTSMSTYALGRIEDVIPHFRAAIPGLRVFGFHADLREAVAPSRTLDTWPSNGRSKNGGRYTNCTYLGVCLREIARLQPYKTIVISDGGVADKRLALKVADEMTGEIDTYYCASWNHEWQDRAFMEQLARRGRGRCSEIGNGMTTETAQAMLRRSLCAPLTHGAQHMRHRIPGGRVDIHAPPVQVVRVEEHIVVERQRIIHHVDADDVHVQENAPTDTQIQIEASHVRAHENHQVIETRVGAKPRGFLMAFVLGPAKRPAAPQQVAPQLAPPQVIDKGLLRSVPQQAGVALPPLQRQATPASASGVHALPAPQRHAAPQPNAPPQLAHQPEPQLPMPAQRKKSWSIL